jgi:type I restriction enzyme, S subunit
VVDGPFGSSLRLSDYDPQGTYPVITISNINEGFDLPSLRKISEKKYQELKRSSVRANDILVAKIGSSYGKVGLYPANMPIGIIPANLLKITPNALIDWRYLVIALRSSDFKAEIEKIVQVTAQPAFGLSKFKLLPIAVPPVTEQHRIVAKVDELMALCDRLEAQLTTTQTQSRRLLESTLHQALNGKR